MTLHLLFLIGILKCFHGAPKTQKQIDRETLVLQLIENPSKTMPSLVPYFERFVNSNDIDESMTSDILTFKSSLQSKDPTSTEAQSYIVYPYVSNYFLYLKRMNTWRDLKSLTLNDAPFSRYKDKMGEIFSLFYFKELEFMNQVKFTEYLCSREPSLYNDIPSYMYSKYEIYFKYIKMKSVRDRLVAEITKCGPTQIHEYKNIFTEFKNVFEIKVVLDSHQKFEAYISNEISMFADESFIDSDTIWPLYEKYVKYEDCSQAVNNLKSLFERNDDPKYSIIINPIINFRTVCNLKNNYDTSEDFETDIRKIYSDIKRSVCLMLYPRYKYYIIKNNQENAIVILWREINKDITKPILEIQSQLRTFVEEFDLENKEMDLNEMQDILKYNDVRTDRIDFGIILTKYNGYVKWQHARAKKITLFENIGINNNIKSVEIKNEMDEFLTACNIFPEKNFKSDKDFSDTVSKILFDFNEVYSNVLHREYKKYKKYLNRLNQRNKILNLIKSKPRLTILDLEDSFDAFQNSHFEVEEYPDIDGFRSELKNLDLVEDDDIDLLHSFYSNYIVFKEKKKSRENLMKKHITENEPHIYFLQDEVEEFIETHYLKFDQILKKTDFDKYLEFQNLGISEREKNILFFRYYQNEKYQRMVGSRENLIKLVKEGRKLSQMYEYIQETIDNFDLDNIDVYNFGDFTKYVENLDKELISDDIIILYETVVAYKNLLKRIPTKNELFEFITLNPHPRAADLHAKIRPFIESYGLKNLEFSEAKIFYMHLLTQEDNIKEELSDNIFIYYLKYVKIKNRWNIRDSLLEYLQKDTEYRDSNILFLVSLFVEAYELSMRHFSNINEFKIIATNLDEDFDDNHAKKFYDPVVKYLKSVDRHLKREALFEFSKLRTESNIIEKDKYVRRVIDSYLIDDDILYHSDVFKEHVGHLDYTISSSQVQTLHDILLEHSRLMRCYAIKETTFNHLNQKSVSNRFQIFRYIRLFMNAYNIAGEQVYSFDRFLVVLQDRDPKISTYEANTLYPYYLKYLKFIECKGNRLSLLGIINKKSLFLNPLPIIQNYIKSHIISKNELYHYDRFYLKNKALDEEIPDSEIKTIYDYMQNFINSNENIEDIFTDYDDDVSNESYFNRPTSGIKEFFFQIFKYFGLYPHLVKNIMSVDELTHNQSNFNSVYKFFVGVDYFYFPLNLISMESPSITTTKIIEIISGLS